MRVELKKLMEQLGVGHTLSPYETNPWFLYDEVRGVTCSAEVRMGPTGDDVEAEIQFLYDDGREPEKEAAATDGKGETGAASGGAGTAGGNGGTFAAGPRQIMYMRAEPADGLWTPKLLRVKGEDFVNKIYDWEGKGCNFFRSCIEAIQMSELPNIDELMEKELDEDDGFGGGRRGRIGRKAPKIKPAQLLGMKKGM